MTQLSSLRARLASFEHAYAIAARLHDGGVHPIFIVRTAEPLQPIKVTGLPQPVGDQILAAFL